MEPHTQGKPDRFRLLTETGPGTLMGKLMRRFWQPIALSEEIPKGAAKPLRVLSEDLTLYRGESGKPHLVAGRCAHRCTLLHTGWVEGDEIRCMYHGWRYDGTGLCTEIPAEKEPRRMPVRITGYPLQEYCGLIFAWLADAPAPAFELPRKHVLEDPGCSTFAKKEVWDCNWFAHVENSLDAVHVSFAHKWGKRGRFGSLINTDLIPDLAYEETSAGIRQIATRSKDNVRISDWTFPNCNHIIAPGPEPDEPWADINAWPVPIDDKATMRFTIYSLHTTDAAKVARLKAKYDLDYNPVDHTDALFRGNLTGVSEMALISAQDYVAVRGQGEIYDRSRENLSTSDAGVDFLRKIFFRELEAIRQGQPTKQWSRLTEAQHLPPSPAQAAE